MPAGFRPSPLPDTARILLFAQLVVERADAVREPAESVALHDYRSHAINGPYGVFLARLPEHCLPRAHVGALAILTSHPALPRDDDEHLPGRGRVGTHGALWIQVHAT